MKDLMKRLDSTSNTVMINMELHEKDRLILALRNYIFWYGARSAESDGLVDILDQSTTIKLAALLADELING